MVVSARLRPRTGQQPGSAPAAALAIVVAACCQLVTAEVTIKGALLVALKINSTRRFKYESGEELIVDLTIEDDEGLDVNVDRIYRRLSDDSDIDLLLGPYSSVLSAVAAIQAGQVPKFIMLAGAASPEFFKSENDQIFGVDKFTTNVLAPNYFHDALNIAKDRSAQSVAFLHDGDTLFAGPMCDGAVEYAHGIGLHVLESRVKEEQIVEQVNHLKALGADVLVGCGDFDKVVDIVVSARALGYNPHGIILPFAASDKFLATVGAPNGNYILSPAPWVPAIDQECTLFGSTSKFVQEPPYEYRAMWGEEPLYQSAEAGAGILAALAAVELAGSASTPAVTSAMLEIDLPTFYGRLAFFANGSRRDAPMYTQQVLPQNFTRSRFELVGAVASRPMPAVWPMPSWREKELEVYPCGEGQVVNVSLGGSGAAVYACQSCERGPTTTIWPEPTPCPSTESPAEPVDLAFKWLRDYVVGAAAFVTTCRGLIAIGFFGVTCVAAERRHGVKGRAAVGVVECATPDSDVYFELLGGTSARAQWMTVESTAFAPRGRPVSLAAADIVRGNVGIFTIPLGVSSWSGPTTVKWCGEWFFRCQGGPLEHDQSLIMTFGLRADDRYVDVHHTTKRCLDEGVGYDMIDVGNSGFFELPLRRALLVEYVYHMDYLATREPGAKGKGKAGGSVSLQSAAFDESAIVSDMAKGSGMAMDSVELLRILAGLLVAGFSAPITSARGEGAVIAPFSMGAAHLIDLPLLRRRAGSDLVERHLTGEFPRGLFFAYKKSGNLRLIVDGRLPSCHLGDSDPASLASGAAFPTIEADSATPVQPEPTWRTSRRPKVEPSDGANTFYPVIEVIPMGWELSLRACQQALEHRARLVPGYVDNCFAFGGDQEVVRAAAEGAQQELGKSLGRSNERWFSRQDEVGYRPRDHALSPGTLGGFAIDGAVPEVPSAPTQLPGSLDFPDIGSDVWDGERRRAPAKRWARSEARVTLEGRAMVLAHLHKTRALSNFGKRHLFLGDAMASILAVFKRRSPSKLMRVCRHAPTLNTAFGGPATDEHGPTMPEKRAVRKPQEAQFRRIAGLFYHWCATTGMAINIAWQLDSAVTSHPNEQFLEGFLSSAGPFLTAALTYCRQGMLSTLRCFAFYTWPSELLRPRVKDAAPPPRGGPRALALWARPLSASENSTPPKSGEFNKSLSLDYPELSGVDDLLTCLRAGRGGAQPLPDLKYATWAALFTLAAQALGVRQQRVTVREGRPAVRAAAAGGRGRATAGPRSCGQHRIQDLEDDIRRASLSGPPIALELFSGSGNFSRAWRRSRLKRIEIVEPTPR
ncbi:unnamed protein product [Prorocentrum cordatum]|uniref:Leucine-binding protein domain-containing protein n=1 Tax=Prorocentrum cordatum TaxID=2364126 RepID=A0ABN9TUT6_9DINO|nr:unnamed protein product [Polarella glacialis]